MPTCLRALCCVLVAAACLAPRPAAAQDDQPDPLLFQGLAQAFANGVANEQVTVLVFSAEWCGPCKKLHRSVLTDPAVRRAGAKMSWAKIDIDKNPTIAAMYGVRAVPTMILLNTRGEPLQTLGGLPSVQRLAGVLEDHADKATEPGTARGKYEQLLELVDEANDTDAGYDVPSDTVMQIIDLIAVPDPIGVEETRHRLVAMGPSAWRALVDALEHRKLAVRAAAYDILKETTGKVIAFDPFLDADKRAPQVKAWRDWLDSARPANPKPEPKPEPQPDEDPQAPDAEQPENKSTPKAPRT